MHLHVNANDKNERKFWCANINVLPVNGRPNIQSKRAWSISRPHIISSPFAVKSLNVQKHIEKLMGQIHSEAINNLIGDLPRGKSHTPNTFQYWLAPRCVVSIFTINQFNCFYMKCLSKILVITRLTVTILHVFVFVFESQC